MKTLTSLLYKENVSSICVALSIYTTSFKWTHSLKWWFSITASRQSSALLVKTTDTLASHSEYYGRSRLGILFLMKILENSDMESLCFSIWWSHFPQVFQRQTWDCRPLTREPYLLNQQESACMQWQWEVKMASMRTTESLSYHVPTSFLFLLFLNTSLKPQDLSS